MNQEINARIEQINRGEVPQGYKKTKVGIVPSDWEVKELGEVADISSGTTPSRNDKDNFEGNINWITSGELKNKYIYDTLEKINDSKMKIYPVRTMIIAIYGLEAAGVRGTASILHNESTISQACMAFTNLKMVDTEFLYYWYKREGQVIGIRYAQGTKQQNLSSEIVHNIKLPLPPLPEQQKIAEILTTQDKVIELKEKLIAEKEQQKKYLMQNLLTGKKRLKGFTGEWKKVKLDKCLNEKTDRNKNLQTITVLSVSNKQGFIKQDEQFGKVVASKDLSNYKIVLKDNIAYNPSRINVGSIACNESFNEGIVSPMYVVMQTTEIINKQYFMYFIDTHIFKEKMKVLLSGSVRDSLNFNDLCRMSLNLPPLPEQNAIAEILSTADREIELLKSDLTEEKQKKKALMQLLLTGIVRV